MLGQIGLHLHVGESVKTDLLNLQLVDHVGKIACEPQCLGRADRLRFGAMPDDQFGQQHCPRRRADYGQDCVITRQRIEHWPERFVESKVTNRRQSRQQQSGLCPAHKSLGHRLDRTVVWKQQDCGTDQQRVIITFF